MNNFKMNAMIVFGAAAALSCACGFGATINVPADQATIQSGINAAANGDVVLVAPGVYPELIDFHGKAITLQSQQGAAVTIIDGQSMGSVVTMDSGEGPGTVVQGFTIRNGTGTFGSGIDLTGTSPVISDNIFLNNGLLYGSIGSAIEVFVGSPVIENNEFVGNVCDSQYASGVISMFNGSSPRIFNNFFHDNSCRAINATLPVEAAPVVFNNTIVRNASGIYIDHRVSNANQVYRNNLIAQNTIGLEVAFQSTPFDAVWTNNLVAWNTTNFSGTPDSTGTQGNINTNPWFADAANGNFHVLPGSGAIDGGTATGLNLPADDFDGQPRVQDGDSNGVATIDIGAYEAPPNHPPVAYAQSVNAMEDTTTAIVLQASDVDGDPLNFAIVSVPLHGLLTGWGTNWTYTPSPNYNGADRFTFKVTDGQYWSDVVTVDIAVASVNDPPVAFNQTVSGTEDTATAIVLQASDVDGDALTYSIGSPPQHGTLSGSGANRTYTPAANFNGSDSFTFVANDGQASSNAATVTILVASVNDAPVAYSQTVNATEDTAAAIVLQASDVDGDALTYSIASLPQHGTLAGSGANRTYTPAANYNGADSFTFVANDGQASSNVATVTLSIASVNDAPTAVADSATTARNTAVTIAVLANDRDVDGDTLSIVSVSSPANGSAAVSGNKVVYTPARGYSGTDQFTYTITDGHGGNATAVVSVSVSKK